MRPPSKVISSTVETNARPRSTTGLEAVITSVQAMRFTVAPFSSMPYMFHVPRYTPARSATAFGGVSCAQPLVKAAPSSTATANPIGITALLVRRPRSAMLVRQQTFRKDHHAGFGRPEDLI